MRPRNEKMMRSAGQIVQLRGSKEQGYVCRFLTATGALRGWIMLVRRPTPVWLDQWVKVGYRVQDRTRDGASTRRSRR